MAPEKIQIFDTIVPAQKTAITRNERTENTRNIIALVFIASYLFLLLLLISLSAFFQLSEQVAKDYLLAIGTPLGFILGYYFKTTGRS